MAANRLSPTTTTDPGGITGTAFADQVAEEILALWNLVTTPFGSLGGTGDAITGTCVPALVSALVDGQRFRMIPTAANTGAVTVNTGQGGALALKDNVGAALQAGDLAIGEMVEFSYVAATTNYRMCAKSTAQISRMITTVVGADQPLLFIGSTTIGAAVPSVEQLFTAEAFEEIEVIIAGLSAAAAGTKNLLVTLRHAGGAIVTCTLASVLTAVGQVGTFTAVFKLDNISATGQYDGEIWGSSNGATRARTVAQGASATPPDRIWVALNSGDMDAAIVTVRGKPIPA